MKTPAEVPLHLTKIETALGEWVITVSGIGETEDGAKLLVRLVLEQHVSQTEPALRRELGLVASPAELLDPEISAEIVDRIRAWLESTEGDGLLDLTRPSAHT